MTNSETQIRLLHVDDDPTFLEVSKQILIEMNPNLIIEFASRVDEALEKLTSVNYDIVVSDYDMPQKNGLDLLRELRQRTKTFPFILFTGKGREEVAIQALNLGANGYISKQGRPETVYGELAYTIQTAVHHRKAELALRKNEEQLNAIIANSPIGIATSDRNRYFLSANEAFCKIFGYSQEELRKMTFMDLTHFEDITLSNSNMTKLASGEISYFIQEKRYIRKDGTIIDGKVMVNALRDKKGVPTLFVVELQDITEHVKAINALRRSNEVLERVGEGVDAGLAIIGKDYHVVWANKRILALGVDSNKKCYQIFNKLNDVCPACGVKKIFEQNVPLDVHEYDTVNSKGEKVVIELRVTPLKDINGATVGALELAVPISERKKAEEENLFIASIVQNTDDAIISKDLNGIITSWNFGAEKIYGYKSTEAVGKSIQILATDLGQDEIAEILQKVKQGIEIKNYQSKRLRKDGSVIDVSLTISPIKNKNGVVVGASTIARDITGRKKIEETMRIDQAKLEIMNEKLQVVGGLARHDVNNKLALAKANAFLLKKHLANDLSLQKYVEGIEAAISSATKILEFSRLYEQIGAENPSYVDVSECFNQAVSLLVNGNTVKITDECRGLKVLADSLLSQLFYNLIDNSLRHGQKVTQIRLYTERSSGEIKIIYEDNGVGILKEHKTKLFDAGFTTGPGTGLGLCLVKKMMQVYGWTINEEGEPGKGAKFVITVIPK